MQIERSLYEISAEIVSRGGGGEEKNESTKISFDRILIETNSLNSRVDFRSNEWAIWMKSSLILYVCKLYLSLSIVV